MIDLKRNMSVGLILSSICSSVVLADHESCTISEQQQALSDASVIAFDLGNFALDGAVGDFNASASGCGHTLTLNANQTVIVQSTVDGVSFPDGTSAVNEFIRLVSNSTITDSNLVVDGENLESHHDNDLRALIIQNRQITRQLTNSIAQRLARNVSNSFLGRKSQNTLAGSSDASSGNLAFWGSSNFSQISEDDNSQAHIDNDIYQFTGGFDKSVGNLFFGAALTYAYAENEQTGQDSVSNTVGITPYLAYQLTDYMYVSGLAGYNYTGVIASGPDADIHEYYTEADLAVFKEINSFILKGRVGVRYNHSYASIKTGTDNSADELTWIADTELGYRFNNGLTTYTGISWEHYDREASGSGVSARAYHEGVFFMRWGADYPIADKLTVGATIETDLSDHDTSLVSGGVNIKMEM